MLIYGTYVGGSADDEGYAIAVADGPLDTYLGGLHQLSKLPGQAVARAMTPPSTGKQDAFVVKLNRAGTRPCSTPPSSAVVKMPRGRSYRRGSRR